MLPKAKNKQKKSSQFFRFVFFFFRARIEIQWKVHFFNFFNIDQNAKKKQLKNYIGLYEKIAISCDLEGNSNPLFLSIPFLGD